jgi:hypothetical protein
MTNDGKNVGNIMEVWFDEVRMVLEKTRNQPWTTMDSEHEETKIPRESQLSSSRIIAELAGAPGDQLFLLG